MERKFKSALLKVLDEKTFKNILSLSSESGVDQAGLSRFINTIRAKEEGKEIKNPKDSLNLTAVSKLIDCLGGQLIFPWESEDAACKSDLEKANARIRELEKENIGLKAVKESLEQIIIQRSVDAHVGQQSLNRDSA